MDYIYAISLLDWVAIIFFLSSILYFNWRIETEIPGLKKSTHILMSRFRREWMQVLITRENRIVDAQILSTLQQSARFFASGTMIAVGGIIALMGKPEIQAELETVLNQEVPHDIWNLKLFFTAIVLANGFFSFIWSARVFGYSAITMAAIPEKTNADSQKHAERAATLNINASRNFNRGLRMIYFALAALCWLLGPLPFILANLSVVYAIWKREFHSHSRSEIEA